MCLCLCICVCVCVCVYVSVSVCICVCVHVSDLQDLSSEGVSLRLLASKMYCTQSLLISYNWYQRVQIILLRGESHEFTKRVDVGVYRAIGSA